MKTELSDVSSGCIRSKIQTYRDLLQKKGLKLNISQEFNSYDMSTRITISFYDKEGKAVASITKDTHNFVLDMLQELERKVGDEN